MPRSSSRIWVGRVVALLVVAALAGYLLAVGLSEASAIAGILGLFVAVLGLVAPYMLPPGSSSAVPAVDQDAPERAGQLVAKSVVRGRLTQVRGKAVPGTSGAAIVPGDALPAGASPSAEPGRQHVTDVWVGGDLTQIDGADGDVTIG